jgi:hypothetical protein
MARGTAEFPILFAPLDDPTNIQVLPMGDPTDLVGDYSELASGESANAMHGDIEDYVESLHTQAAAENEPAEGVTQATKANQRRCIVDSLHLSTLVACYWTEFNAYSKGRKKNVTQLVPAKVWKKIYLRYKLKYPVSPFVEDTLKTKLRETLLELKTGTSNGDHGADVAVQSEQVFEELRSTDGHAKRNVLKRRQSIIDGTPLTKEFPTDPLTPTSGSHSSGGKTLPKSPRFAEEVLKLKPHLTKSQLLEQQSDSLSSLATSFSVTNEKREAYIAKRMEVLAQKEKKQKIELLKTAMEVSVYTPDEFKLAVRTLLDLESK